MCDGSREFHKMIKAKPDFSKFAYKSDNIKTLAKSIASPVYGGSVFLPVAKKGRPRSKKNPLEDEIVKLNTEVLQFGGYYYLPDIKDSEFSNEYLDVYLLAPHIKDKDLGKKIKLIHDLNKQNRDLSK